MSCSLSTRKKARSESLCSAGFSRRMRFTRVIRSRIPFLASSWRCLSSYFSESRYSSRPRSSGADGVASLEMVLGVYESQRLGNAPVTLPMANRASQLYQLRDRGHF